MSPDRTGGKHPVAAAAEIEARRPTPSSAELEAGALLGGIAIISIEDAVGLGGVGGGDALAARRRVHRRRPQLGGHHLAEPLERCVVGFAPFISAMFLASSSSEYTYETLPRWRTLRSGGYAMYT